jgi:hypothetical protein
MLKRVTGERPAMWGPNIIGFGEIALRYASGRVLDWPMSAFSPRASAMTFYFLPDFTSHVQSLKKLGKHSTGKGCLYIKRLDDVDTAVLERMLRQNAKEARALGQGKTGKG